MSDGVSAGLHTRLISRRDVKPSSHICDLPNKNAVPCGTAFEKVTGETRNNAYFSAAM